MLGYARFFIKLGWFDNESPSRFRPGPQGEQCVRCFGFPRERPIRNSTLDVDPREVAVLRGEPAYQSPIHASESYPGAAGHQAFRVTCFDAVIDGRTSRTCW